MKTNALTTDVTILGLGPMGVKLAELLLAAGKKVTLWNRSLDKTVPLAALGAQIAADPAAAIAASPASILILYDYDAVRTVLATPGVDAALNGKLIANLGTGSPQDARKVAALVQKHGGRYLDGAIQAAPSQMGEANTPVFLSGDTAAYAELEPLLRILGGNLFHLGEKIDAAAFMDLASLSYVYGAFAGFLHGAHIAERTGVDPATFGRLVNAISPSFGAFFEYEGQVIASGDFTITESPLRISTIATRRISDESRMLGINTELPDLVRDWLARAEADGLENSELAALIKVLRATSPRAAT
ncbi:NAD(P)-dependent oxidoreductase [Sphingomonas koreensis]